MRFKSRSESFKSVKSRIHCRLFIFNSFQCFDNYIHIQKFPVQAFVQITTLQESTNFVESTKHVSAFQVEILVGARNGFCLIKFSYNVSDCLDV